ncbi:9781_t:CDS:2, partial [Gigaspora rosea]
HYVATYDQVLDMCEQDDSVLYKKDVINCDRQDDGASYRLFCSSLLSQVMNSNSSENIHYGLFVYLFVIDDDLLCAVGISTGLGFSKSSFNDYENDENDFFDDFNSLSQNKEISDSHAIATAASTIAEFNTIDIHDDDIENDLRDARLELAFLLSDASSSNNHDLEIHEKFYTGITEAGALDILYLVNLRKNHKCYSNQNMESKTTYRIQNLDHTNSVSSNMISSLIADCTSNIDTSRTEKLRGIRWKNQCHLSILSNTNKKLDLNGITVANIGEHNPLCKHGYGFAYINHELCLVQIVALYQKNSNYHSYVCGDVFSIDSLSYLSVK